VAYLWLHNAGIAAIIAPAMTVSPLAAALSGIAIPLLLHRMGTDPAVFGVVLLTSVTDVVGFPSFLGLASLSLL
jgi:magnesium transporter